MSTRGVVYVHSSPSAVCPHVEWAISGTLGVRANLQWTAQPEAAGQLRAECGWTGDPGTGAKLVAALKAWPMLRFEVTEEPSPGVDGERFCFAPTLGLWRARTSANGDIVVGEDQLRAMAARRPRRGGVRAQGRRAARRVLGRRAGAVPAGRRRRAGDLAAPGRLSRGTCRRVSHGISSAAVAGAGAADHGDRDRARRAAGARPVRRPAAGHARAGASRRRRRSRRASSRARRGAGHARTRRPTRCTTRSSRLLQQLLRRDQREGLRGAGRHGHRGAARRPSRRRSGRTTTRTTQDGSIVIYRIESGADDTARVLLQFTSTQDPKDAPPELPEPCIHWNVVWAFADTSAASWKLAAGLASASPQHEEC